jgi:chromosome segregation ATPase
MSQPSRTEFNKLRETVGELTVALAQADKEIGFVKSESNEAKQVLEKFRDQLQQMHSQVAVLQSSFDTFKTRWDESDRRRWTVYGVMLAAALTFVANLVLLFLKR